MGSRAAVPAALTAETRSANDIGHIVLTGRLDRDGEAALSAAYAAATEAGPATVEIDFGGVDYINSTGIALVVRLLADARRDERQVRAVGLTEHYREIFTITRLSDFMTIVDTEEDRQP
jgi:anti-sigma B factor antagonist